MATSLIVPTLDREERFDSREYYLRVKRKFFVTLAAATIWGMLLHPVLTGQRDPVLGWLLLFLAVVVGLAVFRNERVHSGLTIVAWALFLASVVGFGLQYGG